VHYVTLSPLQAPTAYLVYVLNACAFVIGIGVCLCFFKASRRPLWLALAAAFLITPVMSVVHSLRSGLPPLPAAKETRIPAPSAPPGMASGETVMRKTTVVWEPDMYLLAFALAFAWQQYRKATRGIVSVSSGRDLAGR